ncbi:MAG: hypothetical protein GY841_15415 [FCB group bacterium]|nr:hypothetical protein [FCB group bacterium]
MTDVPTEVRTTILNVDTGKGIMLQYEPEVISGSVQAQYNADPSLSGTHENMKFSHTANETFELEMRWNRIHLSALTGKTTDECDRIISDARSFVRSLLQPSRLVLDVVGGETPLLIVKCPGVFEVYARMMNIGWDAMTRDPKNGSPLQLVMRGTFKEDPQYRYHSDDIIDIGYERI